MAEERWFSDFVYDKPCLLAVVASTKLSVRKKSISINGIEQEYKYVVFPAFYDGKLISLFMGVDRYKKIMDSQEGVEDGDLVYLFCHRADGRYGCHMDKASYFKRGFVCSTLSKGEYARKCRDYGLSAECWDSELAIKQNVLPT